jgi:RNA polymerase sigma-70 factor (ECF subfamily)
MKNPRITQEEVGIIKKAQAGDESAFNALFYKYKGFVENLLFRYLKDMEEARDIANVVFLKVHDKLSMFTAYDSFGGWLRILTNRVAIDYLRAKHDSKDIEEERLSSDMSGTTEDDLVNHLTYKQLSAELNKLPEATRKVFKLFYEEDMTAKEIGKALKIPVGTIKSTLSRTRRKIKNRLI